MENINGKHNPIESLLGPLNVICPHNLWIIDMIENNDRSGGWGGRKVHIQKKIKSEPFMYQAIECMYIFKWECCIINQTALKTIYILASNSIVTPLGNVLNIKPLNDEWS